MSDSGNETASDGTGRRELFTSVIALLLIFAAFRTGLDRGLDHRIAGDAYGRYIFAIGSTISEGDYGLKGAVLYASVENTLQMGGFTTDPAVLSQLGTKFPDNLSNSQLLDGAIAAARRLSGAKSSFRGTSGDDTGLVRYTTLSFTLFGYNILSLYLTYFTVIVISSFLFCRTFRDDSVACLLLLSALAGHYLVFFSCLLDPSNPLSDTSVNNPRFLGVLGIIPMLHLAMVIVRRRAWRPATFWALIAQTALLSLACQIRASASWMPGVIALIGIVILIRDFRATRPPLGAAASNVPSRLKQSWALGTFLAAYLAGQVYVAATLNPVYNGGNYIAHHAIWHSMYYALQFHPQWEAKYGPSHRFAGHLALGDEQPWAAANNYIARHPEVDRPEIWYDKATGLLKFAEMERYVRSAFFEMVLDDPRFVFESFFVYKPKFVVEGFRTYILSLRMPSLALALLCVTVLSAAWRQASPRIDGEGMIALCIVVATLTGVSVAPILLTVAHINVMAEQCFMLTIAVLCWLTCAVAALGAKAMRWRGDMR